MIIFTYKKETLQIMVTNIQRSHNLRMPVESYKKLIWQIITMEYGYKSILKKLHFHY